MIQEEEIQPQEVSAQPIVGLNDAISRNDRAKYKVRRHRHFQTFVANSLFASPTLFNSKNRVPEENKKVNPLVTFYSTIGPLRKVDDSPSRNLSKTDKSELLTRNSSWKELKIVPTVQYQKSAKVKTERQKSSEKKTQSKSTSSNVFPNSAILASSRIFNKSSHRASHRVL